MAAPRKPPHALARADHVRAALPEWQRIGASRTVLRWLSEGVRVQWAENGPPPPFNMGVTRFSRAERAFLTIEAERCCASGQRRRDDGRGVGHARRLHQNVVEAVAPLVVAAAVSRNAQSRRTLRRNFEPGRV